MMYVLSHEVSRTEAYLTYLHKKRIVVRFIHDGRWTNGFLYAIIDAFIRMGFFLYSILSFFLPFFFFSRDLS